MFETRYWRTAVAGLVLATTALLVPTVASADPGDVEPEAGFLVGYVDEAHSRDTEGATVTIDLGQNVTLETTAGPGGSFDFGQPIPAGQHLVTAYGCATPDPAGETFCDSDEAYIEITHTATSQHYFTIDYGYGSIGGVVSEAFGRPLETPQVSVIIGGQPFVTADVGFDGSFDLGVLGAGEYEVKAHGCTSTGVICRSQTATAVVTSGEATVRDFELDLNFGVVTGVVTGSDGAPLEGHQVAFTRNGGAPDHVTTDESGTYVLEVTAGTTVAVRSQVTVDGHVLDDEGTAVVVNGTTSHLDLELEFVTCEDTAPFGDVGIDHTFCDEIGWLVDSGVAKGYSDGTFRPAATLNRQQIAAFLYRLAGSPDGADPTCTLAQPFDDVDESHPFCGEIAWLAEANIVKGYADGTFRPTQAVTRAQVAAFVYRLYGSPDGIDPECAGDLPFNDVGVGHAFCGEIQWLAANGLANGYGDGGYHPEAVLTRQAAAVFLARAVDELGHPDPH